MGVISDFALISQRGVGGNTITYMMVKRETPMGRSMEALQILSGPPLLQQQSPCSVNGRS